MAEEISSRAKTKAKQKAKRGIKEWVKKIIKRFGWGFILEWTPAIGWLVPGDIMLVWRTIEGNFTSPEGVLMLSLAFFAYVVKLIMGIIEIWFDLGLFTTLVTWLIAGFFALWIYFRGSGESAETQENEEKGTTEGEENQIKKVEGKKASQEINTQQKEAGISKTPSRPIKTSSVKK